MPDQQTGEKTEQPTPKKLKDAREEGQTAQSKELTAIAAIITAMLAFGFNYHYNFELIASNTAGIFQSIQYHQDSSFEVFRWLINSTRVALKIFLLPIVLAATVSLFVSVWQVGGVVITKDGIKFDFNRMNPVENFKNTFSKKNFIKFLRQFFEIAIMSIVAFYIGKDALHDIVKLEFLPLVGIISFMVALIAKIFATLFLLHIIFSIVDFVMERLNLHKQLMMSLHDIKEESKEIDGNPEIKQKRKELHRQLLEDDNVFGKLKGSGIVFANPTHLAVFVVFIPMKLKLPAIILKERGESALWLIKRAEKLEVPVVRDVWLTRKLFALGKINNYVPQSILTYVADAFSKNLNLLPGLKDSIRSMRPPAPPGGATARV